MAINTRTAPFTVPGRLALLRVSGFPIIPAAILLVIGLLAIFAELVTPYNPEIGTLGDRFRPPFWQAGGSDAHLLGTDHLGRDVLSRLIFGARVSIIVGITAVLIAGVARHRARHHLGLPRRLGRPGDHAPDRHVAGPARAHLRHLSGRRRRPQRAEHHRHPRVAVYWTRYARVIRGRGALAQGAGVRAPRHRRRLLQAHDHAQAHPAERGQLGHRARHPDDRGRSSSPRRRCRSSAWACHRRSRRGASCSPTARRA